MSVFSNWSHTAHASLTSAGFRLPLGQVHQILSASLGHASLASFTVHDKNALPKSRYALLDLDRMHQRAQELQQPLTEKDCTEVLLRIRETSQQNEPYVQPLNGFGYLVQTMVRDSQHPVKDEIVQNLQGRPHDFHVFNASPYESIDAAPFVWRWKSTGMLYVACSDSHCQVPITAEVILPRLGAQLLGTGSISHFSQSGEPELYEEDYPTEFDHNSYD
jgi:hypothetical protein